MTDPAAIRHRDRLESMREANRHVPASHPVLRTPPPLPEPTISAMAVHGQTDRIDELARLVRVLPVLPLTLSQREQLQIIARELLRRADG